MKNPITVVPVSSTTDALSAIMLAMTEAEGVTKNPITVVPVSSTTDTLSAVLLAMVVKRVPERFPLPQGAALAS